MTDGMNETRALRIAEIISDFRAIISYITAIRANPGPDEANEEGYVVLRRCRAEGSALLNQPFDDTHNGPGGDAEQVKAHLRRIIADAAYRRFKAQKIYLCALAAGRWANARQAILRGQRPNPSHIAALQLAHANFRTELASITDAAVEQSLRRPDTEARKWLAEDPSLQLLQRMAAANGFYNAATGGGNGRSGNGRTAAARR